MGLGVVLIDGDDLAEHLLGIAYLAVVDEIIGEIEHVGRVIRLIQYGFPIPVPCPAVLAHARIYRADEIADHRVIGVGTCHVLERRIGAIQLAVTDEQFGELRPCGRMVGLQFGHRAECAECRGPVAHLECDEADQEMALHQVGLNPEDLPAVIARPLDLSPV